MRLRFATRSRRQQRRSPQSLRSGVSEEPGAARVRWQPVYVRAGSAAKTNEEASHGWKHAGSATGAARREFDIETFGPIRFPTQRGSWVMVRQTWI
jgi:hypothetical protein